MGEATWTPYPAGRWKFGVELVGDGDQMELVLRRSVRAVDGSVWNSLPAKSYPLFYDAGKHCVYTGERNKTLEEAMAARGGPW